MSETRRLLPFGVLLALCSCLAASPLLGGCDEPTEPPTGTDAGRMDAGVGRDSGLPPGVDGGPRPDSGPGRDAGRDSGGEVDAFVPPIGPDACSGYATRYWDCCKAHCGWSENTGSLTPVTSCNRDDVPQTGEYSIASSCSDASPSSSYTCFSMRPWQVSPTLSYGFAAVPASGDICGRCYQLEFDGTGHYNPTDPGSVALSGKTMIVQATNIGFDVGGGQFDILIPGGGVGAFNACSNQWGVSNAELGAQYGGFLTACQAETSTHDELKSCVRARCEAVFDEPRLAELREGCEWFLDWYEAADNPNLSYREVECPQAIIDASGVDRRPLMDIAESCDDRGTCECDCSWTMGGMNCGSDDGSCCWLDCCG